MANWDVFHGDRLELERDLATAAIREALAQGDLSDDDLVRPAGTAVAWTRLADMPQLLPPASQPPPPKVQTPGRIASAAATVSVAEQSGLERPTEVPGPSRAFPPAPEPILLSDVSFPVINDESLAPTLAPGGPKIPGVAPAGPWDWSMDDDSEEDDNDFDGGRGLVEVAGADDLEIIDDDSDISAEVPVIPVDKSAENSNSSRLALPVVTSSDRDDAGALAEIPEEEEFSLSRSGPMTVEELDLAPMVDVAFQLVLFFMVAAQTVLYKTLEIPKPSAEQAPAAVAQGRSRTLDELKEDYILVEIDGSGIMKIDREPVAADMTALVERLRSAREATHRKAMLLSAEYATAHRNTVLAYDAANEIGLGIVIARPSNPQGPAPSLLPAQPAAPTPGKPSATAALVPN